MNNHIYSVIQKSISHLLKPLVRILLRHGIAYGTFAEWVREAYVDAAFDELKAQGQKSTITNVSSLTGLTRKEAKRLSELDTDNTEVDLRFNRAARVISGWKSDIEYQTKEGQPSSLSIEAEETPSFAKLVKKYSGDMTTVSMLNMLETAGCIKIEDNQVFLIKDAYIPQGSNAPADKINILGQDVAELINTISHNLSATEDQLRFQRKVFHTALNSAHLDAFKQLSCEQSQQLLEKLHEWLKEHQVDPNKKEQSHYVALGIYCYEHSNQEASSS